MLKSMQGANPPPGCHEGSGGGTWQLFPNYVALSRPQPLKLKATQTLLSDDEAVVIIDIWVKSYAWVVTKSGADWTGTPPAILTQGTIDQLFSALGGLGGRTDAQG